MCGSHYFLRERQTILFGNSHSDRAGKPYADKRITYLLMYFL